MTLLASAALVLAGCTSAPTPEPTASTQAPVPTPSATPTPDPVLDPAAGALANLAYFDFVNNRLIAQNAAAGGRDFIDSLVAAGFDKARMEVTPDRTAVDLEADSIQFSVRFDDGCLIGQHGAVTGYVSTARGLLSTGRCLIGDTRPIDW
ncbi:hypothetical protein DDQ50_09425 [Amnibacterium flavum]|uniref:DUF6993 domain-containing protein n=1 Tax=Amnibacterium flavum TaxID=2173173 RepID=A0A2V1HRB3_9MICO|nr:hypothetical protein DDQ50_09425 [Amnibacterium flavum]